MIYKGKKKNNNLKKSPLHLVLMIHDLVSLNAYHRELPDQNRQAYMKCLSVYLI